MVTRHRALPITSREHVLAEGPVWHASAKTLYWVDIELGEIWASSPTPSWQAPRRVLRLDQTVSAVAATVDGNLLVAGRTGLLSFDATSELLEPAARILPEASTARLNDGACDPTGRFVVGSMTLVDDAGTESLFRLDSAGALEVLDTDLTQSNGICWSTDGRRLYHIDSIPRRIWMRDYEPSGPQVGGRELFVEIEDFVPDGICCDAEGQLWVALWGAGEVRRYSPQGEVTAVVDVPAPNTTSVAFVGEFLETLVITTARSGLSAADLNRYPHSGKLFAADVGVAGAPVPAWSGIVPR